ncbi:hypothetical protein NQ176_g10475 [Zarea fungicola]|uniref:Uncharacterized protein n=1 Tax=Zarea fungicola TaxID=93591 RepID=A0ACC1MFE8_9HYPO|nr:hypothetical protein NQ176_g10475 [Lecanicillium fungicola]
MACNLPRTPSLLPASHRGQTCFAPPTSTPRVSSSPSPSSQAASLDQIGSRGRVQATTATTTTTKPKKATKPRPRKPKQDKKVQLPPPVTAMDGFKTGKKFTSTSKTVDAKIATKDALSVDTTNTTLHHTSTIVVSTVTLPTRDAVKTEEPATPVSQAKPEPETISPPVCTKGNIRKPVSVFSEYTQGT